LIDFGSTGTEFFFVDDIIITIIITFYSVYSRYNYMSPALQ
jgi:hypothetical protein